METNASFAIIQYQNNKFFRILRRIFKGTVIKHCTCVLLLVWEALCGFFLGPKLI